MSMDAIGLLKGGDRVEGDLNLYLGWLSVLGTPKVSPNPFSVPFPPGQQQDSLASAGFPWAAPSPCQV